MSNSVCYTAATNNLKAQYCIIISPLGPMGHVQFMDIKDVSCLQHPRAATVHLTAMQVRLCPSPLRWKLSICFSAPAKVSHTVPPVTFHWAESYVVLTNTSICKVYCHLYSTRRNNKLFRKIFQVTERRGLCVWGI